jgi:hypothetical protein
MDKQQIMETLNCTVDSNLNFQENGIGNFTDGSTVPLTSGNYNLGAHFGGTCWEYWQNNYYPQVIKESYPVYISERAKDEGKKAFEIIKMLNDKKLLNIEKVSDFIELMDTLIKIL